MYRCHGNVNKFKQAFKIGFVYLQAFKIGFVYLQKNLVVRFSLQFACNKHVTIIANTILKII